MIIKAFFLSLGLFVLIHVSPAEASTTMPTAVTTEREMVVTANPLATAAGAEILQLGGTAVDAMIAAQAVLGHDAPQLLAHGLLDLLGHGFESLGDGVSGLQRAGQQGQAQQERSDPR